MSRKRYRYDALLQQLVEIYDDWQPTPRVEVMPGTCYDGQRAQDGTDISSRQKHHEWLRQNNLADTSDFTDVWAKAKRQRERVLSGETAKPARREALERAAHQLESGRKRGR